MNEKQVCPNCHTHYLEWDEEIGQWYCSKCDMNFSDEELYQ